MRASKTLKNLDSNILEKFSNTSSGCLLDAFTLKSSGMPQSSGKCPKNDVNISSVKVHHEGAQLGGGIDIPAPQKANNPP